MADAHLKEHSSLIKTPQQLIVVVVLAFLVPVLGIIMIAELVTGGLKVDPTSPAMSEDAIARRLKPVGEVAIGEIPAAAANPGASATVQAAAGAAKAGAPADGKKTYETVCAMCHGTGLAGAPKFGDKAAWKPRLAQGKDALYASALKGKNAMPPRGGSMSLSDADVKAAVDYMAGHGK